MYDFLYMIYIYVYEYDFLRAFELGECSCVGTRAVCPTCRGCLSLLRFLSDDAPKMRIIATKKGTTYFGRAFSVSLA